MRVVLVGLLARVMLAAAAALRVPAAAAVLRVPALRVPAAPALSAPGTFGAALLFDCDGVLVETEELHRTAYKCAHLVLGLFELPSVRAPCPQRLCALSFDSSSFPQPAILTLM